MEVLPFFFHSGIEIISPFLGEWGPRANVIFCCVALEAYSSQEYKKQEFIFSFKQEKQSENIRMKSSS